MGVLPDYAVGMEGGVADDATLTMHAVGCDSLSSFAWMAVQSPGDLWGFARTASFDLPPQVAKLVRDGMELGDANDYFFKKNESKKQEGAVGILTHGCVDRVGYYEHAMVLALIPFCNRQLFGEDTL